MLSQRPAQVIDALLRQSSDPNARLPPHVRSRLQPNISLCVFTLVETCEMAALLRFPASLVLAMALLPLARAALDTSAADRWDPFVVSGKVTLCWCTATLRTHRLSFEAGSALMCAQCGPGATTDL